MIFLRILLLFPLLFLAEGTDTLSVSLPVNLTALKGSCVLVPCTFNISVFESQLNRSGSIYGVWIKGGHKYANNQVVFNGTTNSTSFFERIEIPGNLRLKNCTSVFYNVNESHADKYYFRTEIGTYKVTFTQNYVQLNVQDTLAGPQLRAMWEVAEGTPVNLSCTAAAPCPSQPPSITWALPAGNTHTRIHHNEDGTKSLSSFLIFTASRSHNGSEIFCTASYRRQNGSSVLLNSTAQTLRVLFSPKDVVASVSPTGPLAEDTSVTLTCISSEANPPVQNYSWFRLDHNTPIGSGLNLTFNLSSSAVGLYYCRAEHPQGGKQSNTVSLMIKDKGKTFLIIGAAGGSLVLVLILGLAICVMRWNRSKSNAEQTSECKTSATCDKDGPASANGPQPSDDQQTEVQYGEIDFSNILLREAGQTAGQGEASETEYAEVRTSTRVPQAGEQKGPDTEDLYAQVQKKPT